MEMIASVACETLLRAAGATAARRDVEGRRSRGARKGAAGWSRGGGEGRASTSSDTVWGPRRDSGNPGDKGQSGAWRIGAMMSPRRLPAQGATGAT